MHPLLRSAVLAGFASLRSLLLGSNRLDSWAAVDALNSFPALEEARLSDNPLTAAAPSSARYQCIARIKWVTGGAGTRLYELSGGVRCRIGRATSG